MMFWADVLSKRYHDRKSDSESLMSPYSPCSIGRWYKIKMKKKEVPKGFV